MDKAREVISQFTSHDGEHKTEVDRDSRAAVTEEHIRPHHHEETTQVVDKEIHQDHHQTVIQPILKKEKLAEVHHHNAAPVVHKEFDHAKGAAPVGAENDVKFQNTSTKHEATRSTAAAAAVGSEHVHHHVHQHVQPVIQKEVVEPHVTHNVIPIHETHHAPTVHHGVTTLPVKTLDEYEQSKDKLFRDGTGVFDGCAKDVIGDVGAGGEHTHHHHHQSGEGVRGAAGAGAGLRSGPEAGLRSGAGAGLHSSEGEYKTERQASKGGKLNTATVDGGRAEPLAATSGAAATGAAVPRSHGHGTEPGSRLSETSSGQSHVTTASGRKVSLKDKLNPFKDADGDGKKGIMS